MVAAPGVTFKLLASTGGEGARESSAPRNYRRYRPPDLPKNLGLAALAAGHALAFSGRKLGGVVLPGTKHGQFLTPQTAAGHPVRRVDRENALPDFELSVRVLLQCDSCR